MPKKAGLIDSQLDDWEYRLEQVSAALGITSSELLWKNAGYMKTP